MIYMNAGIISKDDWAFMGLYTETRDPHGMLHILDISVLKVERNTSADDFCGFVQWHGFKGYLLSRKVVNLGRFTDPGKLHDTSARLCLYGAKIMGT